LDVRAAGADRRRRNPHFVPPLEYDIVRTSLTLAAIAALALTDSRASAQCGTGGGRVLDMPATAALGDTVTIKMDTPPPTTMVLLMFSLGQGPIDFGSYGTLCLDFPPFLMLEFTLDATGHAEFSGNVPCDPAIVGVTVYGQFITCSPGGGRQSHGSSNQASLTIVDGICDGGLCTFTQGGWGAGCSGNNPGCLRDKYFGSVFPNGVTIGDPDGIDGGGEFALHFTTSASVEAFLPAGGPPGELTADQTDPMTTPAGVFAGQLLAAKLNLAFDDAGALDGCKSRPDFKLGGLVFKGGVDSHLLGWSVREIIELSDSAISGALGSGPFDVDADGNGDVTLSDLSDALDVINGNFDGGKSNHHDLGLP
jgi:hypothetical protein